MDFNTEIKVKIKGEADVHWTEQHTHGKGNTHTVHYRNHEQYFKKKFDICGEGDYI